MPRRLLTAALVVAALTMTSCAAPGPAPEPTGLAPLGAATPSPTPSSSMPAAPLPALAPTGELGVLASGLRAPWSIVPLATGSVFLSERDTARIVELSPEGRISVVGTVPGVVPGGEGGLLGLAALDEGTPYLYAYYTAAADNRIVRLPVTGTPGQYRLGAPEVLLAGIPKARTHNGGRLAFGPDGMLYATTGDAQQTARAQDPGSLAGKILRIAPDGGVPADNPTPGSYVYSLGHRNPQGIAFDADGQLWAAEFGQNTWDELNRIVPGANYGWPVVEGADGAGGFRDPVQQWATSEASPSGIAIVEGTLFMTGLRGQRLWSIDLANPGGSRPHFVERLGRIRDAVATPDGRLLIVTNNTDGRGDPGPDDDRLIVVELAPRG
ncbi:PQQ-dependent sugar dehydrogenase [Microcella humidisoli]|uniref:PQQ-dependent sugar dehydrogenase n=1 Tax=Microcella humidisoli TaxID=2963406 RepID=A0ABY5FSX3_9MICO|nr:PQQ-dependent sugar dehydrogenase [Microcella humidisoli]UTT61333.1 PQQ-dependent sugar dehydrogenase [Microcella humidisoli]